MRLFILYRVLSIIYKYYRIDKSWILNFKKKKSRIAQFHWGYKITTRRTAYRNRVRFAISNLLVTVLKSFLSNREHSVSRRDIVFKRVNDPINNGISSYSPRKRSERSLGSLLIDGSLRAISIISRITFGTFSHRIGIPVIVTPLRARARFGNA